MCSVYEIRHITYDKMSASGTKQTVRSKCNVSEVSVNVNQYKKITLVELLQNGGAKL